jgi:hypothetical protein
MSISRGPSGKVGVRPHSRSIRLTASSRLLGDPAQRISTAAFQNRRCAVNPTGSEL